MLPVTDNMLMVGARTLYETINAVEPRDRVPGQLVVLLPLAIRGSSELRCCPLGTEKMQRVRTDAWPPRQGQRELIMQLM